MDSRNLQLAHNLINYSVRLQKGEKLLIELIDEGMELAQALIQEAYKVGGIPFLTIKNLKMQRELLLNATTEQMKLCAEYESLRMKNMDAYIAIRGSENVSQLSDVPADKMEIYSKYWMKPVHSDIRVPKTKWCVLRYPNGSMAQLANMSTDAFTDFYYNVCNLDYAKMGKAMECAGDCNIPDGEVYTAPIKDSVNGTITYNTPSIYQGTTFENVSFTFENGKIVKATANHTEALNKILDTDEGARYIGEFSFGLNPYVTFPMKDILFDEKISGSLHFTPGCAYEDADNTNRSAVHWDLVLIQTPEYGGGEIYLDDELIRKDGRFVEEDLLCLNPENLK